jgi:hypothetical protein
MGFRRRLCVLASACAALSSAFVVAQAPPAVTLTATCTAPCNQPATILLSASAAAASGRQISRVEFYEGATLLATDMTSPFASTRTAVAGGSHSFTAKAYDNGSPQLSTTSAVHVIAVNTPPTVSLQATCSASPCVAGSNVSLAATPIDADGSVTKVEFYRGSTLLTTRSVAPWSALDTNLASGSYSFTARAFDNGSMPLSTTSAAQSVTVTAPPPTVSLTASCAAPCNQAATVTLAASAAAATGRSIAKVEFYDNAALLGTITSSPYSMVRASVVGGAHSYTAKAFDNGTPQLNSTSAAQAIVVNAPPTVNLSVVCVSPCTAPATVSLTATAADADGSVSKVEFYRGATLIGARTESPWTFTDSTAPAGTSSYTAKAYDNAATPMVTTSAVRSVTVGAATTVQVPIVVDGSPVTVALPGTLSPTLTFTAQAGDTLSLRVLTDGLPENLVGAILPLGAAKHLANYTGTGDASAILFDSQYPQFSYQNGAAKEVVSLREGFVSLLVRQTGTYSLKLVDYGTTSQTIGFSLLRAMNAPALAANASVIADTQRAGQPILYQLASSVLGSHFALTLRNRLGWMDGLTPQSLRIRMFRPDGTLIVSGTSINGDYLVNSTTDYGDQHLLLDLRTPIQVGDYRVLVTPVPPVAGGAAAFTRTAAPGGTIVPDGSETTWTPLRSPVDGISYEFQAEANVEYTLVARTTELPPRYRNLAGQLQSSAGTSPFGIECCSGVASPMVGTRKFTVSSAGTAHISLLDVQGQATAPPVRFSLLTGFSPSVSLAPINSTVIRRGAPYYYDVVTSGLGNMAVDRVAVYAYLTGEYKYDRLEIGSCPPASADRCSLVWNVFAQMRPGTADPRPRSIYPVIHFANGLSLEGGVVHLQDVIGPGLVLDLAALRDGMVVADDQVSFRGSVTGGKNISVFVNDVRVPTRPGGEFVANNVALPIGQSTINILAVTPHETRTHAVNVSRSGQAPITVEVLHDGGLSPLSTSITVRNTGALPWVRVGVELDGDGIDDASLELQPSATSITIPFVAYSTLVATITVYGSGNVILHRTKRYLLPHDISDVLGAVSEVHAGLATDLEAFATGRAHNAFTANALVKFKPIIQAFGGGLTNASIWLGSPSEITLGGDRCELKVQRYSNNSWKNFRIQLLRDQFDGLWRIADM